MTEHRKQWIAVLLAVIYVTEGVLAGMAHRHCHVGGEHHAHTASAGHAGGPHAAEFPRPPFEPRQQDDEPNSPAPHNDDNCAACRYLAQASLLPECEAEVVSPAHATTVFLPAGDHYVARPYFIRRARSPPAVA